MKGEIFKALVHAADANEPVALGIISGVKGSSPQKLGAKALFYTDGRIEGTLGGGCLEAEIQQRALDSLRTGRAATFDLLLDHDFGWDDGLICGGKVQGIILPHAQRTSPDLWRDLLDRKRSVHWGVRPDFSIERLAPETAPSDLLYEETVSPPWNLWIAGAGHIAQAVAPLAQQLDFDVTVFDDRPALLNHQFFPPGVTLRAEVWDKLLATDPPAGPSFGLIVTRGHRHDALVLQNWIHKSFLFLGMIGSARKARTIFEHFVEEKIATPEDLKRVTCPVGIRIGSVSVMEIAVSIMAQYVEKRAELRRAVGPRYQAESGKAQTGCP